MNDAVRQNFEGRIGRALAELRRVRTLQATVKSFLGGSGNK